MVGQSNAPRRSIDADPKPACPAGRGGGDIAGRHLDDLREMEPVRPERGCDPGDVAFAERTGIPSLHGIARHE